MGLRVVVRSREGSADPALSDCTFELAEERVLVGRGPGSDIRLPALAVGARHLSLRTEGARLVAIDHGSLNGTRLNGTPLVPERPRAVRDGDRLEVGPYVLELQLGAVVAQATTRERTVSLARRLLAAELGGAEPARLVVMNGPAQGRDHPIPSPPATLRIGRATSCAIALDDADASREHAELVVDLDGVVVKDLGSKNGIEINGKRVPERRLRDRDELLVGATVLLFEDPAEAALAARTAEPEVAAPPPAAPEPAPIAEPGPPEPLAAAPSRAEPTEPVLRPPATPPRRPFLGGPELVVLVLAVAVAVASIAGLVLLFGE